VVEVTLDRDPGCTLRVRDNDAPNGFGLAVRTGLAEFRGESVAIVMADGSDAPEDLVRFHRTLQEGYDCVFGTRFSRHSKVVDYPLRKLLLNRLGNRLIQLLLWTRYNDTTNAFKGYRRHVIEGCRPFVSPHFNLTIEIPLKAIVRGYTYKTLPITWRNRTVGESALKLKEQGSRYLYTLLTVWFEYLLVRHDTYRTDSGIFEPWQPPQPEELEPIPSSEK